MGVAKADRVSYLELVEVLDEWYVTGGTGGRRIRKSRLALYRCTFHDCGKLVKRRQDCVRRKHVRSCGCYHSFVSKQSPLDGSKSRKKHAGKQIGRFQVLELIGTKGAHSLWRAICLECGTPVEVTSHQIAGDASPCHCRHKPIAVLNGKKKRIRNMLKDIQFYQENPGFKGADHSRKTK